MTAQDIINIFNEEAKKYNNIIPKDDINCEVHKLKNPDCKECKSYSYCRSLNVIMLDILASCISEKEYDLIVEINNTLSIANAGILPEPMELENEYDSI